MADEKRAVYLEELEGVPEKDILEKNGSQTSATEAKSTTPAKRQRTLMEMMSSSQGSSSEPSSKRLKSSQTSSSSTSASPTTGSLPKTMTSGLQPLNSIPFSMSAYLDSMTEDQRNLLKLECETMGKSWLKVLKDELTKPYFIELKKFLWKEGVKGPDDVKTAVNVYPQPKDIYAWSNTPLGRLRVVIIGQDPYHGPGQAHGLCFSVPRNVAIPPSLRNIYKEIKVEYPEFTPPKHGNLSAWAENGVLLLNTALTVRAREAGSHSNKGWEQFTDKVVDVVDKYGGANLPTTGTAKAGLGRGIVFLAWGAWAAKRVSKLDKKKHLILTSAHPSPLSASKGFLGNGHFKKANDWLEERYGKDGLVDWCKLD